MGVCSSCESTSVATAKLILHDGSLQEFSYPVKVSYVLQKNSACFICNSDEMEFNDVVSAVSDDEELQPGQLYFALPLSRLKCRLQAEEMAALAVKASSALSGNEKGYRRNIVVASGDRKVTRGGNVGASSSPRRRSGGDGRKQKFTARLSAIPE